MRPAGSSVPLASFTASLWEKRIAPTGITRKMLPRRSPSGNFPRRIGVVEQSVGAVKDHAAGDATRDEEPYGLMA